MPAKGAGWPTDKASARCGGPGLTASIASTCGGDGGDHVRETGFPRVDVEYDFLRTRRRQFLATLAHRLRGDGNRLVPLDEMADPASWRGERHLGLQTIP